MRKCSFEGCDAEFTSGHELRHHKMESHNNGYSCIPCRKKFKWKQSFVRHSKECKNASPIYTCDECDYFSFRKYVLHNHRLDQHEGNKTPDLEDTRQSQVHPTYICGSDQFSCLFIGGGKIVNIYGFDENANLKYLHSYNSPLNIEGIACSGNMLAILGGDKSFVQKLIADSVQISLEDKEVLSFISIHLVI